SGSTRCPPPWRFHYSIEGWAACSAMRCSRHRQNLITSSSSPHHLTCCAATLVPGERSVTNGCSAQASPHDTEALLSTAIDETKLQQLLGQIGRDFGATMFAALTRIGDKLGLYKALAATEPQTPAELAARTGTAERYVREWLNANAAGGYVTYHPES